MSLRIHIGRLIVDESTVAGLTPSEIEARLVTGLKMRFTSDDQANAAAPNARQVIRDVSDTVRTGLR